MLLIGFSYGTHCDPVVNRRFTCSAEKKLWGENKTVFLVFFSDGRDIQLKVFFTDCKYIRSCHLTAVYSLLS